MKQKDFSIKKRKQSFKFAINGLRILLCEESNAWIHLSIAICVLVAGFVFKISVGEWIVVIFCIGFVFALELINTAIENMADFVSKEYHDLIKKTKDLTACCSYWCYCCCYHRTYDFCPQDYRIDILNKK